MFIKLINHELRNNKYYLLLPIIINAVLLLGLGISALTGFEPLVYIGAGTLFFMNQIMLPLLAVAFMYEAYDTLYGKRAAFTQTIPVSTHTLYYSKLSSLVIEFAIVMFTSIGSSFVAMTVTSGPDDQIGILTSPVVIIIGLLILVSGTVELMLLIALTGRKIFTIPPIFEFVIYYILIHTVLDTVLYVAGMALIPWWIEIDMVTHHAVLNWTSTLPITELLNSVSSIEMATTITTGSEAMVPIADINARLPIGFVPVLVALTAFYLWFTPWYMRKYTNV